MNPRSPFRSLARRVPVLTAAACLALSSAGCFEEDELGVAIEEVAAKLEALGTPGSAVPGEELNRSTYENAISTLRPHIGEGSPAQQAAAQLLIARSELGLAEPASRRLSEAHRRAAGLLALIQAEASKLAHFDALAQAAGTFDPSAEIDELRGKITERQQAAQVQRDALADVERRIAELDDLARAAEEEANSFRIQEGELRDRARTLTAPEALPLHEQAAEQRRQADALSAQAERRRAEADVIRPEITEIQAEIDRLTEQARLFEQSIEELNAEAEESRRQANKLADDARAIRETIRGHFESLTESLDGQVGESFDAARERLDAAASAAKRAASSSQTASRLLVAEIAQRASSLGFSQAQLAERVSELAEALEIDSARERAASIAEDASAFANEQLREAIDSLESSRVSGEAADRIDTVLSRLRELLGEPEEPGLNGGEPAAVPGEQSTENSAQDNDAQREAPAEKGPDGDG